MLPRLAWLKFYIMIVYLLLLFTALVAAALICPPATTMFINNFIAAEKEEVYLTELEQKLECTTDDDKEVPDWMVSRANKERQKYNLELLEECANEFCEGVVARFAYYFLPCRKFYMHFTDSCIEQTFVFTIFEEKVYNFSSFRQWVR